MNKVVRIVLLVVFFLGAVSFSFAHAHDQKPMKVWHVMKKGDTLWKLSIKYRSDWYQIKVMNKISDVRRIPVGKAIIVRKDTKRAKAAKSPTYSKGAKTIQIKEMKTVKEVEEMSAREIPLIEEVIPGNNPAQTEKAIAVAELPMRTEKVKEKEMKNVVLADGRTGEQPRQISSAPAFESAGASNIIPIAEDKSKLAQEGKEPVSKPALEFTQEDVVPENAPEAKEAQSHVVRGISTSEGIEHQLSLNLMSSRNKPDKMTSGMLDYMAWMKTPSLGENFSLGAGVFASAWEDRISNARISAIMPGVQLGFKYNRHTDDHMMRMVFGKVMVGRQIRSVRQKSNPTLISPADPMLKMMSMESSEAMPEDDAVPVDEVMPSDDTMDSDEMNQVMSIDSKNNFRLGTMLGMHYQLNPKSTLELMNENWFSLDHKNDMEMDPAFSLIGSHVLTLGDWSWKLGLGPQYEDWSKTWRLHVVPAEITYKDVVTLGVFSDLYPWRKGEMYRGYSSNDLVSVGAVLRFNIGTSMHEGHVVKNE